MVKCRDVSVPYFGDLEPEHTAFLTSELYKLNMFEVPVVWNTRLD